MDLSRHVMGGKVAIFDYIPFFVVGVVLASLWQTFSIWLGVKLRIGIFWIASLYLVFKMYGTYEICKKAIS